ncbi:E3 ubiquitin-protein ligase BRE1A, partial [Ophiophagus hannah]
MADLETREVRGDLELQRELVPKGGRSHREGPAPGHCQPALSGRGYPQEALLVGANRTSGSRVVIIGSRVSQSTPAHCCFNGPTHCSTRTPYTIADKLLSSLLLKASSGEAPATSEERLLVGTSFSLPQAEDYDDGPLPLYSSDVAGWMSGVSQVVDPACLGGSEERKAALRAAGREREMEERTGEREEREGEREGEKERGREGGRENGEREERQERKRGGR